MINLTTLLADERDHRARLLATEHAWQSFDLTRGPLLKATLLKLTEQEHMLLFAIHHIVADGWSMGILMRELSELYRAFAARMPPPLEELPIQYSDYARWQQEWLTDETLETERQYWADRLQGSPPVLELPSDRPRPAEQSSRRSNPVTYSFTGVDGAPQTAVPARKSNPVYDAAGSF